MKIAIVGGGWVGCHLAQKLKTNHEIKIFEKRTSLFTQTSYNNQNRLHLGYHYPRNFRTRELCKNTFNKFLNDYESFTSIVNRNYYCIPNSSNIDYQTYLQIFDKFGYEQVKIDLYNIEGSINTKERHIDFYRLQEYFKSELNSFYIKINVEDLNILKDQFDLVINCTNNFLEPRQNSFYELTLTLLYARVNDHGFDAITLVDGQFFSIYPYMKDLYTLTDVEHTPVKTFSSGAEAETYDITDSIVMDKREKMEKKVLEYYPNFLQDFTYHSFYSSVKSKPFNNSADRYPIIEKKDNTISCYTGKIQGIYPIEDYVVNAITNG